MVVISILKIKVCPLFLILHLPFQFIHFRLP